MIVVVFNTLHGFYVKSNHYCFQRYQDNVKQLSTIFRDQPNSPLERGVYWMEYVMRHKGMLLEIKRLLMFTSLND